MPRPPRKCTVLTHCNAGALACKEWGPPLGVVRSAVERGKDVRVIACETLPCSRGQGSPPGTATEGIDVTVIPDLSAAYLMRQGMVDLVLVGATGSPPIVVFNKIGTLCMPYVPVTTGSRSMSQHHSRPSTRSGTEDDVEVEQRGREEVAFCGGTETIPPGVPVINYGFDATPLSLIEGIITEKGVLKAPLDWDFISREQKK